MKKTIAIFLVAIMALTVLSSVDLVAAQPTRNVGYNNRVGYNRHIVIYHRPIHRHIKIRICHTVWSRFLHHPVKVCRWVWVWVWR